MENTLIELYCLVDEFCKKFVPAWKKHLVENQLIKRRKESSLSPSEIMAIYVHFHQGRAVQFYTTPR